MGIIFIVSNKQTNIMKNLFIELSVQDGERRHTVKTLHTTNAENINFAAERYATQYWGADDREGDWWWTNGEFATRMDKVVELTDVEFEVLSKFL